MGSPEKPVWELQNANIGGFIKQPKSQGAEESTGTDLKGRPVDKSKTGTWKAAAHFYAIGIGDFQASIGVPINLVPFLVMTYHQPIATAANITTEFIGSSFLLSVLGGFVADSYLGPYYTIVLGGMVMTLGLSLLTFISSASNLQPPSCAGAPLSCDPAGIQYMAPLYTALYTIALGTGLVRPTLISLGGDQFDESSPAEKKQSVHFFVWFYFFANIGLIIAFTLGVYLQDYVSRGWGYGFSLMLYFTCFMIFVTGTTRIRHKRPTGSFLTRMGQVFVASVRKWKSWMPEDPEDLYTLTSPAPHTNKLRFLDRAAIIDEEEKGSLVAPSYRPNPWRLCSVSQVEESKRLLQLVPVWATTTIVTLVFSQLTTFTIQQGMTLDRHLGPHFEIPSASQGIFIIITALLVVPIYDKVLVPIASRYTGNPYGLTPLWRMGIALVFAIVSMITAALVEQKRLTYARELHLEALPLGPYYTLPMKFWWVLPLHITTALVEFFFYVAAYEFFFHETAETTRSIGSSFTYTSAAIGYFMSVIIVDIVNAFTGGQKGGSWLNGAPGGQLQNGGLEKFFWLLAGVMIVGFIAFLICAHLYEYKHDWYQDGGSPEVKEGAKEVGWPPAVKEDPKAVEDSEE